MVGPVPYWCGIALLLLLFSLIPAIDWYRNRQKATKPKEYSFVLVSGVIGTLFGFCNDLITSSISPEYFTFGKGLASGDWLTLRAGLLGMKAGFAAGAIAGAICLYANTRRDYRCSPLDYRKLLGFLWRPVAAAPTTAFILALFFRQYDPLGFSEQLKKTIDLQHIRRFLLVWWIHLGLYFGLLLSVVWIFVDITKLRQRQSLPLGSQEDALPKSFGKFLEDRQLWQ